MKQSGSRVVALVATFNSGERLRRTLRSLQAQTHPDFHVLISDDCSTDNTLDICKAFATGDARFRVIEQPARQGWVGNVNALLSEARGDYFFFMPHDDELDPTYVEKLTAALDGNPNAVLAFSDLDCFLDGERLAIQSYGEIEGEKSRIRRARTWLDRSTSGWCVPYRGLFRSETAARFVGLRKHRAGEFGADWAWLLHMTLLGEFVRVPEVLYRRNRGRQSLSESWGYGKRNWLYVTIACGGEIRRTRIPLWEKSWLQFYVFVACVKELAGLKLRL